MSKVASPRTAPLCALPAELRLAVAAGLGDDWPSLVALSQTCRSFYVLLSTLPSVRRLRLSAHAGPSAALVSRGHLLRCPDLLLERLTRLEELEVSEAWRDPHHWVPPQLVCQPAAVGAQLLRLRNGLAAAKRLTSLKLTEHFATSVRTAELVAELAPNLRHLALYGYEVRPLAEAPGGASHWWLAGQALWEAVASAARLESLDYGFCCEDPVTPDGLRTMLRGHPHLRSLTLRGLQRVTAEELLGILASLAAPLRSLSLHCVVRAHELMQLASGTAVLSSVTELSLRHCGFVAGSPILHACPSLRRLSVSIAAPLEPLKLALVFLHRYAGESDLPAHRLDLLNDMRDVPAPQDGRPLVASRSEDEARTSIRHFAKLHDARFDVDVRQLPPPPESPCGTLEQRLLVAKGRAAVTLRTLFRHHVSLALPPPPQTLAQ